MSFQEFERVQLLAPSTFHCDLYLPVKLGAVCKEAGLRTRPVGGFRESAVIALGSLSTGLCVLHQELASVSHWGWRGSGVHHSSISTGLGGLLNQGRGYRVRGSLWEICPKSTFLEHSAVVGEWI